MKKYLIIIVMLLFLTACSSSDNNMNSVNLYLFYSSTCPHCHEELAWLDKIKSKYKNVNIIKYEASQNFELYDKVVNKMNVNSYGVPLTVIGSDFKIGFNDDISEEIESMIDDYSKFESCDLVDAIKNDKNIDSCNEKNDKK